MYAMWGGSFPTSRIALALALACKPKLLLADEPTTGLDATVQIQFLLLRELQRETGMAIIFVTHDIGAAVEVADRIAVMYAGRIVEENTVAGMVTAPTPGGSFAPRCGHASARCAIEVPAMAMLPHARLACWHPLLPLAEAA